MARMRVTWRRYIPYELVTVKKWLVCASNVVIATINIYGRCYRLHDIMTYVITTRHNTVMATLSGTRRWLLRAASLLVN